MKFSIKEHKTPIAVTAVGLLVAIGLASAPSLLAESETEIRAAKNSDELKKLSASVSGQSAQMQQQLDSLESSITSRFSSIENQIQTLNKATSRLHLKQKSALSSPGISAGEFSNLENQVKTLHKATKQLHLRQKSAQDSPGVSAGEFSNLENQVKTLHKATKQLHLRQKSADDAIANETGTQEPNTVVLSSIGALEKKTDARVTNLEKAVSNLNNKHQVTLSAIAAVETQQSEASESSQNISAAATVSEDMTRRRLEVDIKFLQLERAIIQLGKKLDNMEVASEKVDPNIERLQEIRRNADRLLKKIAQ